MACLRMSSGNKRNVPRNNQKSTKINIWDANSIQVSGLQIFNNKKQMIEKRPALTIPGKTKVLKYWIPAIFNLRQRYNGRTKDVTNTHEVKVPKATPKIPKLKTFTNTIDNRRFTTASAMANRAVNPTCPRAAKTFLQGRLKRVGVLEKAKTVITPAAPKTA